MITRNTTADSRPIFEAFNKIPLQPLYLVAALTMVASGLLDPGDWRLLAVALTALLFNSATILLTLRIWPTAIAVLGLGLAYLQQAAALVGMCFAGLLGHLDGIGTYSIMIGNEFWVLLLMCLVSLATLLVLGIRQLFMRPARPVNIARSLNAVAADPRFGILLLAAAGFTLTFWIGGAVGPGLAKAVLQTFQRAFMFVPFLAGFYFRVSKTVTVVWIVAVVANLGLGIITGGRSPAFIPIVIYCVGVLFGATLRQRWIVLGLIVILAVPGAYIFGMIESIRTSVGRLTISEITMDKITEVTAQLQQGKQASRDAYDQLPSWVHANYRLLTWPTVVVAAATGGQGPYRGFEDLPQQIAASLNVVAVTGEMGSYYNEGLYNLRAANYGFTVDTGTSVEFGYLAESWDRGGPMAAFAYALIAIIVLALVEAGVRFTLEKQPVLRTVAVSVIFTTAFWTMNIYNLPLSLRQIPVNLIICYLLFGAVSFFAPPSAPMAKNLLWTASSARRPGHRIRSRQPGF